MPSLKELCIFVIWSGVNFISLLVEICDNWSGVNIIFSLLDDFSIFNNCSGVNWILLLDDFTMFDICSCVNTICLLLKIFDNCSEVNSIPSFGDFCIFDNWSGFNLILLFDDSSKLDNFELSLFLNKSFNCCSVSCTWFLLLLLLLFNNIFKFTSIRFCSFNFSFFSSLASSNSSLSSWISFLSKDDFLNKVLNISLLFLEPKIW